MTRDGRLTPLTGHPAHDAMDRTHSDTHEYVLRQECERIHSELNRSRETNIRESKDDRSELRNRQESVIRWCIGIIVTLLVAGGTLFTQNWNKAYVLNETLSTIKGTAEMTISLKDDFEEYQKDFLELKKDFKDHQHRTIDTNERMKKMLDKRSKLITNQFMAATAPDPLPEPEPDSIASLGRIEYDQAIRDAVVKLYTPPDQRGPEWKEWTRENP